jgi:hypothetical protein
MYFLMEGSGDYSNEKRKGMFTSLGVTKQKFLKRDIQPMIPDDDER